MLARTKIRLVSLFGSPLNTLHSLRAREALIARWILSSFVIGVATGLLVAAFDYLLRDQVIWYLYSLRSKPAYALLPVAGLLCAWLATRTLVPSREGELTEDYILVFHDKDRRMRLANLPGKLIASFVTIASGGNMGLEGPAIYTGAILGDSLQNWLGRYFGREDRKMLLVAGASAGMAAIFKAPLTGVVFAMEAPYKDSLAGRALVPALIASSASYVTFAALVGSEPLFGQSGFGRFGVRDILYAALLGLCCGIGARLFVWITHLLKHAFRRLPGATRPLIGGLAVGALGTLVFMAFGEPYIYGPGYMLIRHTLTVQDPLSLLLLLFGAKLLATAFTVAGGGVGGLFFPQAVLGVILGSIFTFLMPGVPGPLFPLIGLAAFVGAGYRTPLAAVAFVAETTGNPWVLIPAMIATVVSFLVMGQAGVSERQQNFIQVTT